jgi:hypothetical protein
MGLENAGQGSIQAEAGSSFAQKSRQVRKTFHSCYYLLKKLTVASWARSCIIFGTRTWNSFQVVEAAAAFFTSRILSGDKENLPDLNSNVGNNAEGREAVGVTPSKRKAEERRGSVKRVGTALGPVSVGIQTSDEDSENRNGTKGQTQTVEVQIPARPALADRSNRVDSNLSILTKEFSVLTFVDEPDENEENRNEVSMNSGYIFGHVC